MTYTTNEQRDDLKMLQALRRSRDGALRKDYSAFLRLNSRVQAMRRRIQDRAHGRTALSWGEYRF